MEFVGADKEEIALMYNTTDGMNAIVHGLRLEAGDEVLLSDQEHPSGNEPWRLRQKRDGIVIKHFPMGKPPADTAEVVARRSRLARRSFASATSAILPACLCR